MSDIVLQRMKYLNILEQDLTKNEKLKEEEQQKIKQLEETRNTVELLTEGPKWSSLIPLAKRVFVPGNIKHTGEYLVETKAHPSSYRYMCFIFTVDNTKRKLQRKRVFYCNI